MGIRDDINEIKEMVLKDKAGLKEKKFRFPFGKKVGKSQKKKNYVTILFINENGTYYFKKYQVIDQTIMHKLIPRLAHAGYVIFNSKGHPLMILPEWSVEPFSPKSHFDETLENGSNIKGYSILLASMKSEQVNKKKTMGSAIKWIAGIALAAIIGYAFLTGGG